jgi:hypothetical protein
VHLDREHRHMVALQADALRSEPKRVASIPAESPLRPAE